MPGLSVVRLDMLRDDIAARELDSTDAAAPAVRSAPAVEDLGTKIFWNRAASSAGRRRAEALLHALA